MEKLPGDRRHPGARRFAECRPGLLFLLALMVGCSPQRESRTVVRFWAMGVEGENVQKLMPEFERRNPNIEVQVQMIPWNAAHEKLLTGYAGSSLPDMCQLGNTWIPEMAMLDALELLGPWVGRSSSLRDSSYFPGIWSTNFIDSLLYGVPWYVDTRVLFYRSDLLARVGYRKPPASWDEWFDVSAKLTRSGAAEYAVLLPTNNEFAPPLILGMQKNSSLLKDGDTYGAFSGGEFTEAMRVFHSFFTNGWAPVKTTQIVNIYQSFSAGLFAMYISGPWNIGEFSRRLPPELQDKWMTAPLPGPDGNIGVSLAGGSSLVMFRSSPRKEAVWKVIEYLSEPDQQLQFYRYTGNLPARVEAWRDSALASNRYAAAFFTQLNHVRATPKVPEWEQIAQKLREYSELIAMDQMSVEDAMAALDRSVNVMLEKRRWMVHGK